MKLVEIKGLFEMDYGAPSPMVISNDSELFVSFYANKTSGQIPQERNIVYDTGIVVLKFKTFLKFNFGMPGTETIHGHPYHKLGLRSCSFYEMLDSDLMKELQKIDQVHPYYNSEKWKDFKHYILTFHDNMFECIAKEFEVNETNESVYQQTSIILNQLSVKQF